MTRDYKNSRVSDKPLPGWLWFIAGLAIGLSVAMMVWLSGSPSPQIAAPAGITPEHDTRGVKKSDAEAIRPPERRFDFYTLLPELEVVIPEPKPPASADKTDAQPPSRQSTAGGYVLQAGSFQRLEQADSLKARLALLGVQANIQSVRVDNDIWHRVRVGPYPELSRINQARTRLRENNIDTLLMRVRE